MPLKEAIVVNPERELSVPTFNKEQIKDIAREADHADSYEEVISLVNEGIEKGDIAIPTSGIPLGFTAKAGFTNTTSSPITLVYYNGEKYDQIYLDAEEGTNVLNYDVANVLVVYCDASGYTLSGEEYSSIPQIRVVSETVESFIVPLADFAHIDV